MRIRKRAVPFPLSSLLVSDPPINLNRPPPVQLHPGAPSSVIPDCPIGQPSAPTNGSDSSDKKAQPQDSSELILPEDEGEKKRKKKMKDNDTISDNVNVSAAGSPSQGKKRSSMAGKRGTIMEGSRCSRVNGRGWRCCQQTLVGYSLCQHHLGKGRLRSKPKTTPHQLADVDVVVTVKPKKGTKLGMVKARSLSSLLGQTTPNHNHNHPPQT